MRRKTLPTPAVAYEVVAEQLADHASVADADLVRDTIATLYGVASQPLDPAEAPRSRRSVKDAYGILTAVLCHSPLGERADWPRDFWEAELGRLIFYAHRHVYGADLLSQRECAARLGRLPTTMARLQARRLLEFVCDPDARNPRRDRRFVTTDMLASYRRLAGLDDDEDSTAAGE